MHLNQQSNLDSFPKFSEWFATRKQIRPSDGGALLVWEIAHILSSFEEASPDDLATVLMRFCREVSDPQGTYLEAEIIFDSLEFDFPAYLNQFAEIAIIENKASLIDDAVWFLAEETDLITFYFLSAWIAFNRGNLDDCIDRCDHVDTATNQILTLHGQALLEKGFPDEAIRIFEGAMDIDPTEALTAFQACKAYLLVGNLDKAWETIEKCDRLVPFNPEIAAFAAMIALESPSQASRLSKSWDLLDSHLDNYNTNTTIVTNLIQLSIQLEDQNRLNKMLPRCNWGVLYQEPSFLKELGPVLRDLGELGWHKQVTELLNPNAISQLATG